MERLTEMRFEGTDRVEAWCPKCHTWISEVGMIEDCHPYNRDYAYCEACHTGLLRSDEVVTVCMGEGE